MSILEVGDGVFEVLFTSGDTHLSGGDFDEVGVLSHFNVMSEVRLCY